MNLLLPRGQNDETLPNFIKKESTQESERKRNPT
jgi:hypothetical protein